MTSIRPRALPLLAVAVVLAACGGGDTTDPATTTSPAMTTPATTGADPTSDVEPSTPADPTEAATPSDATSPTGTSAPTGDTSPAPDATPVEARPGFAILAIDGGPTFEVELSECVVAPDEGLPDGSFSAFGSTDTLGLTISHTVMPTGDIVGASSLGYTDSDALGLATFPTDDFTVDGGTVAGPTTFNVLGGEVEGLEQDDTGTVTFAC